jgi:hypothetical protein
MPIRWEIKEPNMTTYIDLQIDILFIFSVLDSGAGNCKDYVLLTSF